MTATTELEDPRAEDRPASKRPGWHRWIAPVLIAVVGLVAAGMWWQVFDHRSEASRVRDAEAAAERIVVDLLTYRHDSVAEELDAALGNVTGAFAEDYRRLVNDAIVPVSRERQLDTEAVVVQSGIVESSSESVTVLLFVDQATRSIDAPGTRRDISRIEVTVREVDDTWKIDRLEAV